MRSFYQRLPHPKETYSLQGASRGELLGFVVKAMDALKAEAEVDKETGMPETKDPFN